MINSSVQYEFVCRNPYLPISLRVKYLEDQKKKGVSFNITVEIYTKVQ